MIHTQVSTFFILIIRRLEKAITIIIQDVIHINAVVHLVLIAWIKKGYLAGIRCRAVGTRVTIHDKIMQIQAKRQINDPGAIGYGELNTIPKKLNRLTCIAGSAINPFFLCIAINGYLHFEAHRATAVKLPFLRLLR